MGVFEEFTKKYKPKKEKLLLVSSYYNYTKVYGKYEEKKSE